MDMGSVRKIDIDHEMQQSYLDYAMSVIVSRALPDARDGLKPVQRRLLYAMYDMGVRADSAYKKSARIVGEVLGKYHPHGDQAVYEAMARLAQDFSMRCLLVDGQGNFGSVDGDPPAAMRYTEARLTSIAMELLSQIDRDTVDFVRNFDDSLDEPLVLPSAIPNMLVNGASGIAVGMATSIPPHNLVEVIDGLAFLLDNWQKMEDITVTDLMKFIKGPDFPTGGIILQEHEQDEILAAYATGKGRITLRGRLNLEEMSRGKSRIIISELPYMTNKSALIERIAELTREGLLEGISDLRDESDRQGMRIVIELNKAADAEAVLRELYKRTPLQVTFSINLLALVNNEPRLLPLKQALRVYLEHRIEVVKRRSEFDLRKAQERIHILEGLRIALQNLDEVIAIIKKSTDTDDARERLIKKYKLTLIQANAILDMPLKRLAQLERKKIEQEYRELVQLIKELLALLRSPAKQRQVVGDELKEIRTKYADRRKTQIVNLKKGKAAADLLTVKDVTPVESVWVVMDEQGRIGKINAEKPPRMSGRDAPVFAMRTDSHQTLYLVGQDGQAAAVSVQSVPEIVNPGEGSHYSSISPLRTTNLPASVFYLPAADLQELFVLTITRQGLIKKTLATELKGPSSDLFTLVKVNEGDELADVLLVTEKAHYLVVTRSGMAIRFEGSEVRPMGLLAAGVNAIKLSAGDEVAGMIEIARKGDVVLVASNGAGWRVEPDGFPLQGRYGQGVIGCRMADGVGLIGVVFGKKNFQYTLHLKKAAAKTCRVDDIGYTKRAGKSEQILQLASGDRVERIVRMMDSAE
ncbi:MAG TPA: DNA topoisomerase 4 subunit A [Anaerolineaceae bacterium]|nr:DNA topoisomerase 4 subunit A [Anaerolineaceae bacterium]HRS73355.1 DNA topoisomerase 4 subunit A [Anaerolineaceae bacterium]